MKHNEIRQLHEKNADQLKKELDLKRKELYKLKLERKVKPQKNSRVFRIISRDIARILTVIQEVSRVMESPKK